MNLKTPEVIRETPESCAVGEFIPARYVPHWDGRIRLTEFFLADPMQSAKPWIFAASYKGLDPIGWKRIE